MKRNEWMAIIATCFLLFAVCLSASAKNKKDIERGMTKQEVIDILGEPKTKSFDEYGDKWEFYKSSFIIGDDKAITILFDRNGKVVRCNTRIINTDNRSNGAGCPTKPTPPPCNEGHYPNADINYGYCLSDASFSILYNKVKKASFNNEKYDLLEVACLGCNFSCQQAIQLMKIFSFDDERMKVLRMVAPRIVDSQNANDIRKIFTFDDDKDKVGEIMQNCRHNEL